MGGSGLNSCQHRFAAANLLQMQLVKVYTFLKLNLLARKPSMS